MCSVAIFIVVASSSLKISYMEATLNNLRMSPRKVRLVSSAVKGKSVAQAKVALQFLVKAAALPLQKLLKSAVDNAKNNFNTGEENLLIKEFRVDGGKTMKRSMPRARGSAYQILKRTSKVTLILTEKQGTK